MKKNSKKIATCILSVAFATSVLNSSVNAMSYSNINNKEIVVEIKNGEDMQKFRDRANGGELSLNTEVTGDIDLSGVDLPLITVDYSGTFDGNLHNINLNAVRKSYSNV